MIGYLFAALALAAALTKAYCSKKSSIYVRDIRENTFSNGIRMLFCIGIGLGFVLAEGGNLAADPGTIAIALLAGVSSALHITTWLSATKRGALMLLNIFYLSGVLVPLLLCYFLYDEPIRPIQWAGLAVLMAAVTLCCAGVIYTVESPLMELSVGDALFEAVSAAATVGVSSDLTPYLQATSKVALMITMFIGRVGIVSFVLAITTSRRRINAAEILPEGKIIVG